MPQKTFREILEEKLQPKSAKSAPTAAYTIVETPHWLDFQVVKPAQRPSLGDAYPASPRAKMQAPPCVKALSRFIVVKDLAATGVAAAQVLGFSLQTDRISERELKKSYRTMARQFHPDHHAKGLSPVEKERLTSRFQALQAAYELLQEALIQCF
jgi:hypothetical protein